MIKGSFVCIDGHTCGNPVRLVTTGHPDLFGQTMSEKRQDFLSHYDWIRTGLMFEPRGHDMMSGAFIYPPCSENADASILFIETSGCLPMCGHGTIGAVTAGIENNIIHPKTAGILVLDVPAGQITIEYQQEQASRKVTAVKLYNVASYLAHQNIKIEVKGLGQLTVDVAYGGNYYIIVEPQEHFPGIDQWSASEILMWSPLVRQAVNGAVRCVHPLDSSVNGATHVLWTGLAKFPASDGASAVFYGDKAIDRSPCGTGTSARMAQLYAKGQLQLGQQYVHESYIGSKFTGKVEQLVEIAVEQEVIKAIKPSIEGWAHVYGNNTITLDDDDPYVAGFSVT
jgi:4-hydroxyproline epimerase